MRLICIFYIYSLLNCWSCPVLMSVFVLVLVCVCFVPIIVSVLLVLCYDKNVMVALSQCKDIVRTPGRIAAVMQPLMGILNKQTNKLTNKQI